MSDPRVVQPATVADAATVLIASIHRRTELLAAHAMPALYRIDGKVSRDEQASGWLLGRWTGCMSFDSDRDASRARQVHTLAGNVGSFCPRCGYDLRATLTLSGARCPECGVKLPFDQLRHFNAAAAARRRDLLIAVIVFASLAGLTAVLLALNWPRMTGFPWKAVAGPAMSVLAGGVIAVSLTVALPRLGNYRPDYPTRAFLLTPICLIGALLLHRGYPWVVGGICAISVLAALVSIAWRKCWFDRILRAVRERWSRTVR